MVGRRAEALSGGNRLSGGLSSYSSNADPEPVGILSLPCLAIE